MALLKEPVEDDGETGAPAEAVKTPEIRYSECRRAPQKAASYNTKYERELHKRVSNRREKRLLSRILSHVGSVDRLLDVPCGAGRLSPLFAAVAAEMVEVDYSVPIIELCRRNAQGYVPLPANANAFALPFRDDVFDLVACIRLSHHVPNRNDRLRLLSELIRVSRSWVLITFFDEDSLKNRIRSFRRRLGRKKRGKHTLRSEDVATLAASHGYEVVGVWPLSRLFSGHVFTLLRRV